MLYFRHLLGLKWTVSALQQMKRKSLSIMRQKEYERSRAIHTVLTAVRQVSNILLTLNLALMATKRYFKLRLNRARRSWRLSKSSVHLIPCSTRHKCKFHNFLSIECSLNHCFHLWIVCNNRVLLKFPSRRRFLQSRRRCVQRNLEMVMPQNAFRLHLDKATLATAKVTNEVRWLPTLTC